MENLKNHRYNEVQSSDRVPPEVKIMNDYWIKDLWPLHKDLVFRIIYFGSPKANSIFGVLFGILYFHIEWRKRHEEITFP